MTPHALYYQAPVEEVDLYIYRAENSPKFKARRFIEEEAEPWPTISDIEPALRKQISPEVQTKWLAKLL